MSLFMHNCVDCSFFSTLHLNIMLSLFKPIHGNNTSTAQHPFTATTNTRQTREQNQASSKPIKNFNRTNQNPSTADSISHPPHRLALPFLSSSKSSSEPITQTTKSRSITKKTASSRSTTLTFRKPICKSNTHLFKRRREVLREREKHPRERREKI